MPPVAAAPAAAPVAPAAAPANGAAKGAPQAPVVKPTPVAKAEGAPVSPATEADPVVWEGKVNGVMKQVRKSEADRYMSKGAFADQATREARELAKAAQKREQELIAREASAKERAKKDLDAFLKEHDIDFDEAARARLERRVAEGKMTPEEKRAAEAEARAKELEAKLAERTKTDEQQQEQQRTAQLERNIQGALMGAVKRAGMETGPDTLAALHASMEDMFSLNLLPMDGAGLPPHVADRIVEDAQARIAESQSRLEKAVIAGLKGAALKARLGDAVYKQVLADAVEEVRSKRPGYKPQVPGAPPPPPAPVAKPTGYIRSSDYDAKIAELGRKHA